MEFFIKKDSVLPILKLKLIQDGINDFNEFHTMLENSSITFSMKNEKNGIFKILNRPGGIVAKTSIEPTAPTEYYVYYRWSTDDIDECGRYIAQFNINFLDDCTNLIVPLREQLYINISDSFVNGNCNC